MKQNGETEDLEVLVKRLNGDDMAFIKHRYKNAEDKRQMLKILAECFGAQFGIGG